MSGVNLHTNGTEFYGNSSNLAFLGNLYAGARNQADNKAPDEPEPDISPMQGQSSRTSDRLNLRRDVHGQSLGPTKEAVEAGHTRSVSEKTQPSIVNLLYNPNYSTSPISPQTKDQNENKKTSPVTNAGGLSQNTMEGQLR